MRDPEGVTWDEWASIIQVSVKAFIRDVDRADFPEGSPIRKLRDGFAAAVAQYEKAVALKLATQDTERLDLPER